MLVISFICFTCFWIPFVRSFEFSHVQNPHRKTWWAKRVITDDFYTAGRLTAREMKYASEVGFKTILSLDYYAEQEAAPGGDEHNMGNYYPSTSEAEHIVQTLSGIEYEYILEPGDQWNTVETVTKVRNYLKNSPKWILFHCSDSYKSTFLVLLALCDVETNPKVTPNDVIRIGATLGYDFATADLLDLIETITLVRVGEAPFPNVVPSDWYKYYWHAKPMYGQWFLAGAIQSQHLDRIGKLGIKTIWNTRGEKPSTSGSISTHYEEVTLLNVDDFKVKGPSRQTKELLEEHRLDPNRTNEYISLTSEVNYDSWNPLEFGDEFGYNETIQKATTERDLPGVTYVHYKAPKEGGSLYSVETFNAYKDQLVESYKKGPVLVGSRSGFRSAFLSLVSLAVIHDFNSSWALDQRQYEVGFNISHVSYIPGRIKELLNEKEDGGNENEGENDECTAGSTSVTLLTHDVWIWLLMAIMVIPMVHRNIVL